MGLWSWEVRAHLYEYGRQLAIDDYPGPWKHRAELDRLANEKLERDAYDLMHSLLYYETKAQGEQACFEGYRDVANSVHILSGK